MNHRYHLCLVSAQPIPNLTPVLDSQFRPDEVILLVSPDMKRQADCLKKVLQPVGVGVREWGIEDAWDIEHIQERLFTLLDVLDGSIVLNVTGGTKPMSIAAYEIFRGLDLAIFYVHPQKDRVIWMYPKTEAVDIENRMRLPQFLQAHGVIMPDLNRKPVVKVWRQLSTDLIQGITRFSEALGTVNHLASKAQKTLKIEIPKGKESWLVLKELLLLFERAGVLRYANKVVSFPNEESRFFVNGGWLEQHVFSVLQGVRQKQSRIHDAAQGLEVQRGGVKNEIDVAFLCDNTLHLIECKTKQFKDSGAEALYKLDSLAPALGGLRTKAMLISFQKINKSVQKRAEKEKIFLCVGQQLQQLESHLLRWIKL